MQRKLSSVVVGTFVYYEGLVASPLLIGKETVINICFRINHGSCGRPLGVKHSKRELTNIDGG